MRGILQLVVLLLCSCASFPETLRSSKTSLIDVAEVKDKLFYHGILFVEISADTRYNTVDFLEVFRPDIQTGRGEASDCDNVSADACVQAIRLYNKNNYEPAFFRISFLRKGYPKGHAANVVIGSDNKVYYVDYSYSPPLIEPLETAIKGMRIETVKIDR